VAWVIAAPTGKLVLERCSDEEFGKQVVTVTTSRGGEKVELLLSTVVQACSPPPPMGMGLSICRSIIEAHEGRLWVTADNGRGAIFHFTVPVDPGSPS